MYWKKLKQSALSGAEAFLREREHSCVNAVSRFTSGTITHVWAAFLQDLHSGKQREKQISGLLLYGNRFLFPVFCFPSETAAAFSESMPLPPFFSWILKRSPLHAVQGLAADMDITETALETKGFFPASKYDYDLRSLVYSGEPGMIVKTPPGLRIRRAVMADADPLFPLQAGYEQEEVLPRGAHFNPAACRKGLENLIADNLVLAAELEGFMVGKININAQSYTHFQIGGVYVVPEFRNYGIARAMTAALIREFAPQKNRFTLFVKKANIPARRVYDSLGFLKTGDYRITYFL